MVGSKSIGIHQPNYLPWLGFFNKIVKSDSFIILDNVDLETNGAKAITSRTKIRSQEKEQWLTIPILKSSDKTIKNVQIDNSKPWKKKHLKTFYYEYKKSLFFQETYSFLESSFSFQTELLSEWNCFMIEEVLKHLKINKSIILASKMDLNDESRNGRIIEICKHQNAGTYISGAGGKKYHEEQLFNVENIEISYLNYEHPIYNQHKETFLPGLSIIDSLFNCGKEGVSKLLF